MFTEILIIAGIVLLGTLLVYAFLFLLYRKNLTTMLWLRLIPGIFCLCLTLFVLGKFGAYNMTALAICFVVGVSVMLGNFIIVTTRLVRPINRIIKGLNEGADHIASSSGLVSSSSQQVSQGASEQASSIEETSSSLEEMSSMTGENAQNARQADKYMKETSLVVNRANESMSDLIQSMKEISRVSEKTFKIIKTIDEVAFQTNLLALNAAVEAARAGEAGAGFAVVADEVRSLALRAAEAAKNTSDLIEGTVKEVKGGADLATRTSEAFSQVTESTSKVSALVADIAEASNEQAQGIEQVNKAVAEMDKVVQQNASTAEESASASEEMGAQSEHFKRMVNELVALVGAAIEAKTGSSPSSIRQDETPARPVFHAPGKKDREQAGVVLRTDETPPDQVIPFDNEDLTDF
jgi:methyl-accepting chemotaxis protein